MRASSRPQRRIRTRLVWSFSLLSLLIILVFSLFNFLFVYMVEDVFFDRLVAEEKRFALEVYEETGEFPAPRQSFLQILSSTEQLPLDIREEFSREPNRPEYAGDEGRHYHLTYNDEPPFILVAEVSEYLVVRQFRSGIFTFLIVAAVVLLFIAVVIAVVLGNRLARPIESLARLFQNAPPGSLPTGFSGNFPNNEIGVLAQGMEQAVERVNAFIAREQEFTRDVSHELRTPVAVMKGALEVLEQRDERSSDALLHRMQSAVLLMEQNIETLLLIAREEQAGDKSRTQLLPIVENVVIVQSSLLADKSVEVEVAVNPAFAVSSTPGVVQILLSNLISNAFQHTQAGTVSIRTLGDGTLVVADTGPGIDPALESKVFEGFVKGENSAGFGVGLSIVKRLCEHQGWTIDLTSSAEGTRVAVVF